MRPQALLPVCGETERCTPNAPALIARGAERAQVILSLRHKTVPKSINVKEPPTLRDGTRLQDSALFINTRNRPWFTRPGVPRRAGVSSFGFGGSNYHCVLEEFESEHTAPCVEPLPSLRSRLHYVPALLRCRPDSTPAAT